MAIHKVTMGNGLVLELNSEVKSDNKIILNLMKKELEDRALKWADQRDKLFEKIKMNVRAAMSEMQTQAKALDDKETKADLKVHEREFLDSLEDVGMVLGFSDGKLTDSHLTDYRKIEVKTRLPNTVKVD